MTKFWNGNLYVKEGGGREEILADKFFLEVKNYLSMVPKGLNTYKLNHKITKLNQ